MISLCCKNSSKTHQDWEGNLHISHLSPNALGILLMLTIGVSPILCRMFGRMGGELALEGEVGQRWLFVLCIWVSSIHFVRVQTKHKNWVLLWNFNVWGISFWGSQAPFAAAGKVRPDPFSLYRSILCAQLNGFVRILWIGHRGHFVDPVGVEQLAGMRAHIHWVFFGWGNWWHGLPWRKELCGTFIFVSNNDISSY